MTKRRMLLAVASVALLAAGAVFAACGGDDDDSGSEPTTAATKAAPTSAGVTGNGSPQSALGKKINQAKIPEDLANGQAIGKADAKVVVEMYEDFGCPHCLDFTASIEPVLMDEYVATGKVQLVYRYFPLHQITAAAAIGAYCAGEQNQFWAYHRVLFIAQAEANERKGPSLNQAFAPDSLKQFASDLKLDTAKFGDCISSDKAVSAVQADLKSANDLNLPGTPSFVINGKVTDGPASAAEWRKLLDGLLK
ncbi:MAG TPA: thioredoxin domain-containing protein [Tepidiformaceae bacterium]|nr:thioredoxin domain-containing protein [Tepidiformaceae bacterium]HNO65483.1 thioredoxin domain-containing protein [Tepidiformaceae bacterium]